MDLKGKRVAVVGNGSSGVQIVAKVQNEVAKLYTWIRSPTWMTAGFAQKFAGPNGANFECQYFSRIELGSILPEAHFFFADTEKQKALMRDDPIYYLKYRKAVESEMNAGFMGFHKNTPESTAAREVTRHPF